VSGLANRLFGLEGPGFGDGVSRFGWAVPIPAWAWLLVAGAAAAVGFWGYARLQGPGWARALLASVRSLLLLALAVLAAGPRLERVRTEIERDRLVVLVDRSASMGVADGGGETRDQHLRRALDEAGAVFASIAEEKIVYWMAFDTGAVELDAGGVSVPALPDAAGPRTAVGSAVGEALRRHAGHPVSAIVVLSDGRSADEPAPELVRRLEADRVPVHSVAFGSAERSIDFAFESASAPAVAFVDDTVPVTARFSAEGITASSVGTIEIVESGTGLVVERRALTPEELSAGEATIPARASSAGEQRWTVRYIPGGPDLAPQNNESSFAVRFVDQPIRVLYVDGSPRWEHRYLKSLLIREDSVESSCLLLAVNRRFQQEGDIVLTALPEGEAEWAEFDVVILGDLSPELLGPQALADIRSLVGDQGAGLLWLAGPSATPSAWRDTPLADLLPVRASSIASAAGMEVFAGPVVLRPTALSRRLGLFGEIESGPMGGIDDAAAGWSALRWALRLSPDLLKSAAEPLAEAVPVDGADEPLPLVVSMRYGAGRSALVGTDEIWRWRYGRGEPPTERFWLPLIRTLARPRLASLGAAATLEVQPPIARTGQVVSVELTIIDQAIAEVAAGELRVSVERTPRGGASSRALRLTRQAGSGAGRTRYAGSFTALDPGAFEVTVNPDELGGVNPSARFEVIAPDDEMRNPQADHAALAALAAATGGRVLGPEDLGELPGLLPNRRIIIPQPPETATLWDTPLALLLVLSLATLEWVGRRLIRLA